MKIYIDITNLRRTERITGIQRVVSEIVKYLQMNQECRVILLSYRYEDKIYSQVNGADAGKDIRLSDLERKSIFFDIDNVWNMWIRRSTVLPVLSERGIKCVLYLYDIIPVTHPQYVHQNTIVNFLDYLAAYLKYADLILTSAENTKRELIALCDKLEITMPPVEIVPLGTAEIDGDYVEKNMGGKIRNKYLLMVGTIEPRKNHELLLDAYDAGLKDLGIDIVFAGHYGWNVEKLKKRIESHLDYKKNIHLFENPDDDTLHALYHHAMFLVFPSYIEGYGLPIVEALQRQLPVLAADIPVLHEVGKEYCDYFSPDDPMELSGIVKKYMSDEELYRKRKRKIQNYCIRTWQEVGKDMIDHIKKIETDRKLNCSQVKQMVILTAREQNILQTIPFIEQFMPFITELVLCCPDDLPERIESKYCGKLKLVYLTDSEVLAGTELPQDHTMRNFYLRCQAMKSNKLDADFIMSDDDYRPLTEIDLSVFFDNDKYIGYYFYMLGEWKGTGGNPTSFDLSMFRTYEFLKKHCYPCYQFSAHMPQIIHKAVYLEMLGRHPEIVSQGLDEWSTYFNYMLKKYENDIEIRPYVTLMWPGHITDWPVTVQQDRFLFENYYEENYEIGGLFDGLQKEWCSKAAAENMEKVVRFLKQRSIGNEMKAKFDMYCKIYRLEHKAMPEIVIAIDKNAILLPEYLVLVRESCNRLPVAVADKGRKPKQSLEKMGFRYLTSESLPVTDWQKADLVFQEGKSEITVWGIRNIGNYILEISFGEEDKRIKAKCNVFVVD